MMFDEAEKQLAEIERSTQSLVIRIIEATTTNTSPSVIRHYEKHIEQLEREKAVLKERTSKTVLPQERLGDCIELALEFVSNPRAVLKLAFAEPLRYGLNGAYGTPKFSFPFLYLVEQSGAESEMVPPTG